MRNFLKSNGCALLAMLVVCSIFFNCRSSPTTPRIESKTIPSKNCKDCHTRVYKEWSESAHAKAWTNEKFFTTIESLKLNGCKACHAPTTIITIDGTAPVARDSNLKEGVNCTACHSSCPHLFTINDNLSKTNHQDIWKKETTLLCGSCHISTYKEWLDYTQSVNPKGGVRSCGYCHMPLHISLNSEQPEQPNPRKRLGKRHHEFKVAYEQSVKIENINIQNDSSSLSLEFMLNSLAGHSAPTGKYGFKEVRIEVWFDNEDSNNIQKKRLFLEMNNALRPGKNGPFSFRMKTKGKVLYIRVSRYSEENKLIAILDKVERSIESD